MTLKEIKNEAANLGITESEVKAHGSVNHKASWEKAIRYAKTLSAEAEEENRQARLAQIRKSPGAAVIYPVAGLAAYGQALVNGVRRCL